MSAGFDEETALRGWLRHTIADALRMPADAIDDDTEFDAFGLPSFEAVLLSGALEDLLGRPVDATIVFDHPTIARLARALTQERANA